MVRLTWFSDTFYCRHLTFQERSISSVVHLLHSIHSCCGCCYGRFNSIHLETFPNRSCSNSCLWRLIFIFDRRLLSLEVNGLKMSIINFYPCRGMVLRYFLVRRISFLICLNDLYRRFTHSINLFFKIIYNSFILWYSIAILFDTAEGLFTVTCLFRIDFLVRTVPLSGSFLRVRFFITTEI
jgi:hypothetical protein